MASAAAVEPSVIAALDDRFILRDRAAVRAYLEAHPYLIPLLGEAAEQIDRYFGPETPVALEVVADREAIGVQELFALIQTAPPIAAAKRRLDVFDAAWWLDVLDRASCNLTIDVETRVPSDDV